jgi:hypothetical protein
MRDLRGLCEHGRTWLICPFCKQDELSLAEAIEDFIIGLRRERHAWMEA